jgi:hypothetical protein
MQEWRQSRGLKKWSCFGARAGLQVKHMLG